jgi:uncharacterized protein YqfA (UPF0365 family)
MNLSLIIPLIVILLLWMSIFFLPLALWLSLKHTGINVSLVKLTSMKYRKKLHVREIAEALIIARKAEININIDQLEMLAGTGINVKNVVIRMALTKKKGHHPDIAKAVKDENEGISPE